MRRFLQSEAALVALIVIAASAHFLVPLTQGLFPSLRDISFHSANLYFGHEQLGEGPLPTYAWNPFNGFGKTHFASPGVGVLYPLNWLFAWFPPAAAIPLVLVCDLTLAGGCLFALLRCFRLSRTAAALASFAFLASTLSVSWQEFSGQYRVTALGPALLLVTKKLLDAHFSEAGRALRTRLASSRRWIALLALVLAAQFLAGYQQLFFYHLLLAAILVTVECFGRNRPEDTPRLPPAGSLAAAAGIAGLIALGLVLIQLLPTLDFLERSERSVAIDPETARASFHPRMYLSLALPFLYGKPGYPDAYWGGSVFEFWVGACYIGLIPLLLALLSPLVWARSSDARPDQRRLFIMAAITVFLGVLLAAGKHTPVYGWFTDVFPFARSFRWPSKLLLFVVFGACILAAIGLDAARRFFREKPRNALIAAGAAAGAAVVVARLRFGDSLTTAAFIGDLAGVPPESLEKLAPLLAIDLTRALLVLLAVALAASAAAFLPRNRFAIAAAVLLAATYLDLTTTAGGVFPKVPASLYNFRPQKVPDDIASAPWHYVRSQYESYMVAVYGMGDFKRIALAREGGAGGALTHAGVFQARQEGIKYQSWYDLDHLLQRAGPARRNALADFFSIGWLIRGPDILSFLTTPEAVSLELARRPSALPLCYLVTDWKAVPGDDAALAAMGDPEWDGRRLALVTPAEDAPLPVPPTGPASPGGEIPFEIEFTGSTFALTVSSPSPGLLVLNQTFDPNWHATRNGEPALIHRVNHAFRAVHLPAAGTWEIRMSFRQPHRSLGLVTFLLSTAALIALVAPWKMIRKYRQSPAR